MRKFLVILLLTIFSFNNAAAHPLHISIINIVIEGRSMNLTIKTFIDDWETAYYHYHGRQIDITDPMNYNGDWLTKSLSTSFVIKEEKEGSPLKTVTDSLFFDDMSMTIEMHAELSSKPNSLYIYNAILTDIFPDQTNLVIISMDNRETGMKFDHKTKEEELKLR